ncbi:MAG TPA: ATP-grasp domain-containing protein [Streptosporangiaceae bacterium]
MQPRVLVVGERKSTVSEAVRLGYEVWLAQRPADCEPVRDPGPEVIVLTDYTAPGFVDLASDLHQVRPFAAVFGITENALLPAAALTSRLSLPGAGIDTARVLTDKWAMRAHLAERGLSPVRAALGSTAADLRAFGAEAGFPFIAKPVAGTGSFGINLVRGQDQADDVVSRITRTGATAFLMEEFLDGKEISVESFSFGGRHVVVTLTDKLSGADFIEVGHCMPALVDGETAAEVAELTGRFLDAVGLTDGPSHVEVKLTSRGPRIVEGHCRRGGDHFNDLIRMVFGVDMEALTVGWALGRADPILQSPTANGAAAIHFVHAGQGEVLAVDGADSVRAQPGIVDVQLSFGVGDQIGPVRWSLDRPGYVIATGPDPAAAAATARAGAERIQFTLKQAAGSSPDVARERYLSRELDQSRHVGYPRAD